MYKLLAFVALTVSSVYAAPGAVLAESVVPAAYTAPVAAAYTAPVAYTAALAQKAVVAAPLAAYTAPVAAAYAAPAVVTSQSSQVIARNYNGLATPVVAAAPLVAKAASLISSPYVASPYFASPFISAPYAALPAVL